MGLLDSYGMDTITLNGSLEAKLDAIRRAGFTQVMLSARDLAGHPGGVKAAAAAVRASGLRPTGFQVLRDFEGLSDHLHHYKVDIAKDRKSTRLNSSHLVISYAVFCLKKKKTSEISTLRSVPHSPLRPPTT